MHHLLKTETADLYDPFIRFDEFFLKFPDAFTKSHYKEFEGLTYLFSGTLQHNDDLGNEKIVNPGDIQSFVAGKGIHVSDKPVKQGVCHGIRVWLNTAKSPRQAVADYKFFCADHIPYSDNGTVTIRSVIGDDSPFSACCGLKLKDISLQPDSVAYYRSELLHRSIIFNVSGVNGPVTVNGQSLQPGEGMIICERQDLTFSTGVKSARFLVFSAKPVNEKVNLDMLEPFE